VSQWPGKAKAKFVLGNELSSERKSEGFNGRAATEVKGRRFVEAPSEATIRANVPTRKISARMRAKFAAERPEQNGGEETSD
jgi:hypothetical protein